MRSRGGVVTSPGSKKKTPAGVSPPAPLMGRQGFASLRIITINRDSVFLLPYLALCCALLYRIMTVGVFFSFGVPVMSGRSIFIIMIHCMVGRKIQSPRFPVGHLYCIYSLT